MCAHFSVRGEAIARAAIEDVRFDRRGKVPTRDQVRVDGETELAGPRPRPKSDTSEGLGERQRALERRASERPAVRLKAFDIEPGGDLRSLTIRRYGGDDECTVLRQKGLPGRQ